MNIILVRQSFTKDGIFSHMMDDKYNFLMCTLEHPYLQNDGKYLPKLPNGTYKAVKGIHTLKDGVPFETFEITGVEGHTGILFHVGNYPSDSEGCVLVGTGIGKMLNGGDMLVNSRIAFKKFMNFWSEVDEFLVSVID